MLWFNLTPWHWFDLYFEIFQKTPNSNATHIYIIYKIHLYNFIFFQTITFSTENRLLIQHSQRGSLTMLVCRQINFWFFCLCWQPNIHSLIAPQVEPQATVKRQRRVWSVRRAHSVAFTISFQHCTQTCSHLLMRCCLRSIYFQSAVRILRAETEIYLFIYANLFSFLIVPYWSNFVCNAWKS